VTDASSGAKALKLSGDVICTGQSVASSGAGNYTLTCDVKNIGGKYADISLYADGANVDYKAISGNSFSSISLSGSVAASAQNLYVYFYSEAGGNVVVTTVADASNGSSALELATNTVCTGQGVASAGAGNYTLTCDVKNVGGQYADISLYGDFAVVDYKAVTSNSYSQMTLSGNVASSVENLYIYVYQDGAGKVLVDNCSLTKQ